MAVNYASLLLATVISGICIAATLVAFWLNTRQDSFKVTWSAGLLILVGHVVAYTFYDTSPNPVTGIFVVGLLPLGMCVIYGATHQLFGPFFPVRRVLAMAVASFAVTVPPLLMGYDGIALIFQNAATTIFLVMAGAIYFRHRTEAPLVFYAMTTAHWVVGASFALCGIVLAANGQWVVGGAPDNWAERLNIILSITGMTAAGTLAIGLDQTRAAHRHRTAAMTDPLTGLLNRRGLSETVRIEGFGPFDALVVFDLDHFKQINDRHGHAAGDEVLTRFAALMDRARRKSDITARLGGEEFALVMLRATREQAAAMTHRICRGIALERFSSVHGEFGCTVSAGIAFGDTGRIRLDDMLVCADRALYAAKSAGRNRVEVACLPLAG